MSDVQKMEIFDNIVKYIESLGGTVKYKTDSIFWSHMPGKLKTTGITLGRTIWLPERGPRLVTLIHETSHLVDLNTRGKWIWLFEYLMPQSVSLLWFALTIFLSIVGINPLPTLIVAIAWLIAPLPSSERAEKEYRAYAVSTYFKRQFYGTLSEEYRNNVIDNLSGWLYYKMIWRRSVAEMMFESMERQSEDYDRMIRKFPEVKDLEEIING